MRWIRRVERRFRPLEATGSASRALGALTTANAADKVVGKAMRCKKMHQLLARLMYGRDAGRRRRQAHERETGHHQPGKEMPARGQFSTNQRVENIMG